MWKELVLLMMRQDKHGAIMQGMSEKPDKGNFSTLEPGKNLLYANTDSPHDFLS